jgi:acyl carrier protein
MSNGKADRLALEQMNISLASGEVYVAPRNKLDEKLVGIWAEILQIEPETIGINDDFFSLGGHSLLAVMLVSKIKRELEVALPLQALFNLKTIRGTADYIIANTTKPWEQLEEFLEGEESPEGDFVEGAL